MDYLPVTIAKEVALPMTRIPNRNNSRGQLTLEKGLSARRTLGSNGGRAMRDDIRYFSVRQAQESEAADRSTSASVRDIHLKLAAEYQRRNPLLLLRGALASAERFH